MIEIIINSTPMKMHQITKNAPVTQLGCICIKIRYLFQIRTAILIQCVETAVHFFLRRLNFKVLVCKPFLSILSILEICDLLYPFSKSVFIVVFIASLIILSPPIICINTIIKGIFISGEFLFP